MQATDKILSYRWNKKAYKYIIEELPKLGDKADKLNHYIFIIYTQIG